jgi:hypothetical protein
VRLRLILIWEKAAIEVILIRPLAGVNGLAAGQHCCYEKL